jgi:phosphopantothenoylcysteine decarboxylase/phosphopantothenate--cysteine ligase
MSVKRFFRVLLGLALLAGFVYCLYCNYQVAPKLLEPEGWLPTVEVPAPVAETPAPTLPDFIPVRRYESVDDLVSMLDSIDHDIVIVPAALADFAPAARAEGKIPSDKGFDMEMKPVPKVLPLIRKKCEKVIGYKAESGLDQMELVARARNRLESYNLSAVVANDVDSAGKTSASMLLVTADRVQDISGTKPDISNSILNFVSEKL